MLSSILRLGSIRCLQTFISHFPTQGIPAAEEKIPHVPIGIADGYFQKTVSDLSHASHQKRYDVLNNCKHFLFICDTARNTWSAKPLQLGLRLPDKIAIHLKKDIEHQPRKLHTNTNEYIYTAVFMPCN